MHLEKGKRNMEFKAMADNTEYALRANALALWDICFGNVAYAGNVSRHTQ